MIKAQLLSHWGGDIDLAHAAWASTYDQEQIAKKSEQQIDKVIDVIVGGNHDTPKESIWLKFYLEMPIYIERQIDKYRMTQQYQDIQFNRIHKPFFVQAPQPLYTCGCAGISQPGCFCGDPEYIESRKKLNEQFKEWEKNPPENATEAVTYFAPMGRDNITQNELSGRYQTIPEDFIEMPDDVALLFAKRFPEESLRKEVHVKYAAEVKELYKKQYQKCFDFYNADVTNARQAMKDGYLTADEFKRIREFARSLLPLGTMTRMQMVLNLNAFEHIMNQRLAPDAQPEIQQLAKLMLQEVIDHQVAPKVIEKMIEVNEWQI